MINIDITCTLHLVCITDLVSTSLFSSDTLKLKVLLLFSSLHAYKNITVYA